MIFWITIFTWALVLGCSPELQVGGQIAIVGDSGIADDGLDGGV